MIKFAKLTDEQKHYIEHAGIGNAIITGEQVKKTKEVLKLDNMLSDQLRAVRNSVVKTCADAADVARAANDWKRGDEINNNMSGITAVIDSMLYA